MPKVSVIIPIYNVEKYLDECIQSILMQTFRDYELILIDDGSTDRSGVLCDKWQANDDRICVIHKKNGGLSSARNAGLNVAQGKYVIFVDSDDYWIGEDSLGHLYDLAEKFDADVVRGEYTAINSNGEQISTSTNTKNNFEGKLLNSATFYTNIIAGEHYSCLFLFNKQTIGEMKFDERRIFLEDVDFNIKFFSIPRKCMYTNKTFYTYRVRSNSLLTTPRISNLQGMVSLSDVYDEYSKLCQDSILSKDFSNKSIMQYYWTLEEMTLDAYYKHKRNICRDINLYKYHKKIVKRALKEKLLGMPLLYIILPPIISICIIRYRNMIKRWFNKNR